MRLAEISARPVLDVQGHVFKQFSCKLRGVGVLIHFQTWQTCPQAYTELRRSHSGVRLLKHGHLVPILWDSLPCFTLEEVPVFTALLEHTKLYGLLHDLG